MDGKNYLLDTNIVIGLFASDPVIVAKIRSTLGIIAIPIIVIGELFYGAELSSKRDENKRRINELAETSIIFYCDLDIAGRYAEIKSQLKVKWTSIPENDFWIAAMAEQHQVTLASRDAHFNNIDTLSLEKW